MGVSWDSNAGASAWGSDGLCYSRAEEVEFYAEAMEAGGSEELSDLTQKSHVFRLEL